MRSVPNTRFTMPSMMHWKSQIAGRSSRMNLQNEVFAWSLSIRTRREPRYKASDSVRTDIASRVRRLAEAIALASWMQGLREWRTMYHQNPALLCNTNKAITRANMSHPCRIAAKTLGTAFLPLDFLLLPTLRPLSLSQRTNHPRRKRRNAEEALAFDASYKPFKQQKKYERRTIGSHLRHSWEIGAESRWTFCLTKEYRGGKHSSLCKC